MFRCCRFPDDVQGRLGDVAVRSAATTGDARTGGMIVITTLDAGSLVPDPTHRTAFAAAGSAATCAVPSRGSAVEAGRLATFDVDLRVDACQLDPHHERVIVLVLIDRDHAGGRRAIVPVSRQRMVVPSPVGCERMKHVDLVGLSVEAGSRAPVVLLREHDAPRRVLPIFVGPNEAVAIALGLRDEPPLSRPLTHDLMATLVETLDVHVDRVEVTELREGTLLAEVALSGPTGQRRLDSRPSDAVALAVRVDAPLFVSAAVLDEAGALLAETPDDEAIDEEVARFRSLLDALGPADFQTGPGGERAPGTPPDDLADDDSEPDSGPDDPPYSPDA